MSSRFHYRAASPEGNTIAGVMTAETRTQVIESLIEQRLYPIRISEKQAAGQFSSLGFFRSSHYEHLITFTSSLSTMYRAGVPLLRALHIIQIGPKQGRFNTVIAGLREQVEAGKSLSRAMSEFPDIFSKVYTSTINAGEESGHLDEVLDELSQIMEKELDLTRQIKSSIRYPTIVISVIVLAAAAMLFFVIPKFVDFYSAMQAQLPLPTRMLLGTSAFLKAHWYYLVGAIIAGAFGMHTLLKNPNGRLWFDRQILRIPVIGQLIVKGNIARFAFLFRILFKAGLPIVQSLTILADSVKNSAIALEVKHMAQLFREGKDGQLNTEQFKLIPEFSLHLMGIGLESGALERMLDEIGRHYSKQVEYTSRQLTSIIEPILTLILGAFVLVMALAIFLPMWNLIKAFH